MTDQQAPQATVNAKSSQEPRAQKDILGYLVLIAGVGALLWGAVAAVGTGWGFWAYTSGLKGVAGAFLLGIAAILFGKGDQVAARAPHWRGIAPLAGGDALLAGTI